MISSDNAIRDIDFVYLFHIHDIWTSQIDYVTHLACKSFQFMSFKKIIIGKCKLIFSSLIGPFSTQVNRVHCVFQSFMGFTLNITTPQ